MAKENKILVQWVRSGIGFPRKQKTMVRSLGLTYLNQTVELDDSPAVRGLVANIPHLVRVVSPAAKPDWASIPEFSIKPAPPSHDRERSEVPEQPRPASGEAVAAEGKE